MFGCNILLKYSQINQTLIVFTLLHLVFCLYSLPKQRKRDITCGYIKAKCVQRHETTSTHRAPEVQNTICKGDEGLETKLRLPRKLVCTT
ncbi:hypothetical protein AHF37_10604 [Paragonimus kellicotti]|nr:hypothetical protein AHF37_10604 [Paragonimus kellicotti]